MMRANRPASKVAPNIAEIVSDWLDYYKNNRLHNTFLDANTCLNHLLPFFGKYRPNHLTRGLIEQYKTIRLEYVKKRTINKELSYLSSMITWAIENDYANTLSFKIKGFPAKQTKAAKPRPLSQKEITAIYEAIEPEYKLIFLLMADVGLRRKEALHLRGSDVLLEEGIAFIKGKGGKERIVPIATDRLRSQLEQRHDVRGYLSLNPQTKRPYYSIRKALLRAAKNAKVAKSVYHHILRHSFGTLATVAGVDLKAVQIMMGHESPDTTAMYQHLAADYLKEQAKKMNVDKTGQAK
jgi:integrase/recombinase XerD